MGDCLFPEIKASTVLDPSRAGLPGAGAGREGSERSRSQGGPGTPGPSCSDTLLVYIAKSTRDPEQTGTGENASYRYLTNQQKQGRRLFSALQSGLLWNRQTRLRFMTLTSADDSPEIGRSYNHLVTRIRQATPMSLLDDCSFGGMGVKALPYYYGSKPVDESLKLEYLALQTSEGNGVIHLLGVGDYIPQKWLSDTWKEIHGAWNVDIRKERQTGKGMQFARYMLAQYLKGQKGILRCSCSSNWVYPGWRRDFLTLVKKQGFSEGVLTWNKLMWSHLRLNEIGQRLLDGSIRPEVLVLKSAGTRVEANRRHFNETGWTSATW